MLPHRFAYPIQKSTGKGNTVNTHNQGNDPIAEDPIADDPAAGDPAAEGLNTTTKPSNKPTPNTGGSAVATDTGNNEPVDSDAFAKCLLEHWSLVKGDPKVRSIIKNITKKREDWEPAENLTSEDIGNCEFTIEEFRGESPIDAFKVHMRRAREYGILKPFVPPADWEYVKCKINSCLMYQKVAEHVKIISQDENLQKAHGISNEIKNMTKQDFMNLSDKDKQDIKNQLDKLDKKDYTFTIPDKYNIEFGITSVEGGYRDSMEDGHTFAKSPDGSICIFGVFDGHGGSDVAKKLEKDFGQYLIKGIQNKIPNIKNVDQEILQPVIQQLFLEYDMKLRAENYNSGSTVVLAVIINDKLFLVNLGDSRAVVFKGNGFKQVVQETKDHKPRDEEEKQRIIELDGKLDKVGYVSNFKGSRGLGVGRSMGDFDFKPKAKYNTYDNNVKNAEEVEEVHKQCLVSFMPEVYEGISLSGSGETYIVLACDGVWDNIGIPGSKNGFPRKSDDNNLCSVLQKHNQCITCKMISKNLVDKSEGYNHVCGGGDNMTCMVVKISPIARR